MVEYDFPKTVSNNKFFISEANVLANQLALFGDGSDGDVTISADTDAALTSAKNYDNLTIDSTKNFYNDSSKFFIIKVRNTLTLNGIIHGNSKGLAGGSGAGTGGNGGTAGGTVVIFANKIVGNGTISADGGIGADGGSPGSVTTGNYGTGFFEKATGGCASTGEAAAGGGAGSSTAGGGAGGSCATNGGDGGDGGTGGYGGVASSAFCLRYIMQILSNPINYLAQGGSEGGSAISAEVGAGGGGAGGIIIIVTRNCTGTPTITAIGGNGGTGVDTGNNNGGGGGAGGLVVAIANKVLTATVTGGTKGAGDGTNGSTGVVLTLNTQS